MDEKLVEQISTDTGVPQELVSRSAQARAQANGVDVNAILASWSGGEAPAVSSAPVETVVEEAPVETVVEEAPVETVLSYVDEDIPPPAQLSVKIFRALQYGTVFGIVAGFIQAFIVSSYLYEGLILESETLNLIANYTPTQYILNIALTTTFFAVISSDICVTIEAILEDDVTTYLIPVIGSFWRIVLFSTVSQAIIASIVIVLGIPKGLDIYELKEANVIRNRVTGSIVIPLGAILFGGVISVLISQVFINFHGYAPLFALIISAAILLFASMMSSAPKIKITRNEVLIAAAGVITLTVIIASVAASQN